jgi:transporter family-2 protein
MVIGIVVVGLLAGMAVGVQAPLASLIGGRLGMLESVFIVHFGAVIGSGMILALQRGGNLLEWRTLPWYTLTAGLMGMVVISAISYTIPRLGATATITLVVAGQLMIGVVLDHFGWLGVETRPIDLPRILGIGVLFLGIWLIIR